MNKSKLFTIVGSVALTVLIGSLSVFADWSNPTATPPSNNIPAPINVGPADQTKAGNFRAEDVYINKIGKWVSELTAPATTTPTCVDTAWSPNPSTVCAGPFTQVSNCGRARAAVGTKSCSAGPFYTPGEWFSDKLTINYEQGGSSGWATAQETSFTAGHAINKVRIRGASNDGGYCYAYWQGGHIETTRHGSTSGFYSVDNLYYPRTGPLGEATVVGTPTTVGTRDNRSLSCAAYPGSFLRSVTINRQLGTERNECVRYDCGATGSVITVGTGDPSTRRRVCSYPCPAFSFDDRGSAKLCQISMNAGGMETISNDVNIPEGAVVTLQGRHTTGEATDRIDCALDIQYAP